MSTPPPLYRWGLCALSTLWFAHQPQGCTPSAHEARIHGTDLHTRVSLSPSWGHIQDLRALASAHDFCSCGADHSGPGWARSEAQLVPIYQRALSVTAPAYPHLHNSTGACCWPGRDRHHIHTSTGGAKRGSFPRGILRDQARLGAGLARENPGPPWPLLRGVASGVRFPGSALSSVKQGWSWDPPAGLA